MPMKKEAIASQCAQFLSRMPGKKPASKSSVFGREYRMTNLNKPAVPPAPIDGDMLTAAHRAKLGLGPTGSLLRHRPMEKYNQDCMLTGGDDGVDLDRDLRQAEEEDPEETKRPSKRQELGHWSSRDKQLMPQ